ncbi:MAG: hypothetical protein ABSD64_07845 [Terriglobales bacterium]|jgi:hypothetical protein
MKPAMTIFVCVLAAGLASAQSPSVMHNARSTMNTVSTHATTASNEAAGIHQSAAASATHAPAQPKRVRVFSPVKSSTPQAGASSEGAKHRGRMRRGGAILVEPSTEPAPTAAAEESVPAAAGAAGHGAPQSGTGATAQNEQSIVADNKLAANGRRDPFLSPVVAQVGGSGCSTGKKCLEIGTINLRGVVRAENGFIAVVSNGMNKAYFLRENDPVFNGYVVKITGDSVVFQETQQDRLGKSFTREVVKKITAPAA